LHRKRTNKTQTTT